MNILHTVMKKREAVCALPLPVTGQGSTPLSLILLPILYVLLHPFFFTSQLFSLKGGGASDLKNRPLLVFVKP